MTFIIKRIKKSFNLYRAFLLNADYDQLMISNSAKYALKAVIYLASYSSESKKVLVRDLSHHIQAPEQYLAKVVQELTRRGIISSTRGRNGGLFLKEDNRTHSLFEVVSAVDGVGDIESCVLGYERCDLNNPCPLHDLLGIQKSQFRKTLESTKIRDIQGYLDSEEELNF
ncbi:Rrf2 family protein [Robiginitalea myxolifaciens]|uniref:Rrf2 family protein n=1 Tax=Robiginitalea myxolifaciens TaxID=400055 RepID=A0A1I6FY95_9FLAO|nr:Rrf2 family transcriptional regulator [Robiginitalea myxolifaciens]SFR34886.1 Rrf2 family protein [Robiginitalea myxolifaciens]